MRKWDVCENSSLQTRRKCKILPGLRQTTIFHSVSLPRFPPLKRCFSDLKKRKKRREFAAENSGWKKEVRGISNQTTNR